jgi:SAM-dependent methyltransferase
LFAWLAEVARARDLAWDCAAGNGQAAVPLAEFFAQVVATDASAEQIGQLPAHPRIRRYAAPAEASGLEAQSVDLVTVAQALHWLPLPAFWDEARRVLRTGGIIAVWTYGNQRLDHPAIDRQVESFYRSVVGPYWPPERRLVETGYRTVEFPFAELESPTFDMALEWPLSAFLAYVRTWSATNRFLQERGFDPVVELGRELEPVWGAEVRRVRWPLSLRVGRSGGLG